MSKKELDWSEKIDYVLKTNDICSVSFVPDAVIGKILTTAEKDRCILMMQILRMQKTLPKTW